MVNPPYDKSPCELTPIIYSRMAVKEELAEQLKAKLHRTVVEVRDSLAFLGNCIGFQFINEALQYVERSKNNSGIDYIDAILGSFTKRAMAHLTTLDSVCLDVHKAIVDNIYENTNDYVHETFVLSDFSPKAGSREETGEKNRRRTVSALKV